MKRSTLRVLIADDHAIVRKGLMTMLREADTPAEVGEAANGSEAIFMALNGDWDVLLLDITMPGANGIEVLKRVKRTRPELPVIMLTMHTSELYVNGALRAGASGYLSKEAATEELMAALNAVLRGETYVSRALYKANGAHA